MTKITKEQIKALELLGIGFHGSAPGIGGTENFCLSSNDLLEYVEDPVAWLAKYHGVTKEQYLAWQKAEYTVICAGRTKLGKPCKRAVYINVDADEWVRLQGKSYCHHH